MNIKMPLSVAAVLLLSSHISAVQPAADELEKVKPIENELQEAGNDRRPAATVSGDDSQIFFMINERETGRQAAIYRETVVNISGPGEISSSASFKPGQAPAFVHHFEDGLYKWEIVNVPVIPDNIREQLTALRESGDSLEEQELTAHYHQQGLLPTTEEMQANSFSGSFRIIEGSVVDSSLAE